MKRFITVLMSAMIALSMMPVTAFAAEPSVPDEGYITPITEGGSVVEGTNNTKVTFGVTNPITWSEKNPSIGRSVDGWWIGATIYEPVNCETENVIYQTAVGDGWSADKSFNNNKDSKPTDPRDYITVWGCVTPEELNKVKDAGKNLTYKWRFNWDAAAGTGVDGFEATYIMEINPNDARLYDSNSTSVIYPTAEKGVHSVAAVKGTLYDTLQAAVDAAQPGQKVELLRDVDLGSGNIVVNKAVSIDGGANKYTIQSSIAGDVIKVLTNASSLDGTVELKNLSIKATSSTETARAIGIGGSSSITNLNLVVECCEIETTQRGITVNTDQNDGINLTVKGTTISLTNGISDYDTEVNSTNKYDNSRGISLWEMGNSKVEIKDSIIQGFYYSINTAGSTNGKMTVDMMNSSFKGRAAINAHVPDTTWSITDSRIHGINNFGGDTEGFATIVVDKSAERNAVNINNTKFTTYFNETGKNNPNATEDMITFRSDYCTATVDKDSIGSSYSVLSEKKGSVISSMYSNSTLTIYNGRFSTNPVGHVAEGKNIYHQKGGDYFVGSMPASTSGFNAWALQNGVYEETYVAPAEPETPDAPVIDNSGSGADATTNVDASASTVVKDDKAETSINLTTGNKIVENAKENNVSEVVIKAETEKGEATGSTVALPEATVQALAADDVQASVTIKTDNATVTLDKDAVKATAEQAGTDGEVKLVVETKEKNKNKVEIELKLVTSKGTVSDFKGGNVTVAVPVSEELAGKKIVCVYIDENGKYTKMEGELSKDRKSYIFKTGHFSTYAILEEAEADAIIAEQNKPSDIASAKVTGVVNKTYTGKSITQNPVVTVGESKIVKGTDYTVSYKNNVNAGVATLTIKGVGSYTGAITKTFKINPKGTSISKVTGQKKAVKVVWKKQLTKMKTSYVSGYQVQYSTSSKFTSGTSKYANAKFSKGRTTKTIKNLKSGKKYYVRVRTYKSVDGTKCYSSWSKVKSVKTK